MQRIINPTRFINAGSLNVNAPLRVEWDTNLGDKQIENITFNSIQLQQTRRKVSISAFYSHSKQRTIP